MVSLQGGPLLQVNGIHLKGLPLSTANGIRFKGSPSPSEWDSPQGVPSSPQRMGFASWGPLLQSEWDSPHGGPPYPGVPLLQVNGIHLKGFPFSK